MLTLGEVTARLRAAGCVFAEEEAGVLLDAARGHAGALDAMVVRRVAGEPLEQIVGWAEFCGVRITVEPGVFVPRRRTELLVRSGLEGIRPGDRVVDLCCGSGAVGAVLLAREPRLDLHAADVDPAAVRCARRNLPPGRVHDGDLFDPLPGHLRGQVNLVVANAPYVPTEEVALMPPEARDHEHRVALDGGVDGLDVVRRVVAAAPEWLAAEGRLVVESSRSQAGVVAGLMTGAGLAATVRSDADVDAVAVLGLRN